MENRTVYIGVDFSMNSPAFAIYSPGIGYEYLNVFNTCKISKAKNFNVIDYMVGPNGQMLKHLHSAIIMEFRRDMPIEEPKEIGIENYWKIFMGRNEKMANFYVDRLKSILRDKYNYKDGDKVIMGIENYQYASFGDSTIQLIEMTSVFKSKIMSSGIVKLNDFYVWPSPLIKMHYAKNGNAVKYDMLYAFKSMHNPKSHEFHKLVHTNFEDMYKKTISKKLKYDKKGKPLTNIKYEVISPIDDIIDAHFLLEYTRFRVGM